MSYNTKLRMADAIEELLQSNSITKITISDIVKKSGVSRQTFYNNFIDIYDLLYWAHSVRIKETVATFWEMEDFCQAFETATIIIREHKVFYQQLVRKDGINSFQHLFAQHNVELSKETIKKYSREEIDKETEFLLNMYWFGVAQMLVKWIMNGMKEEPKTLARLFYEALPFRLRQYWPVPSMIRND